MKLIRMARIICAGALLACLGTVVVRTAVADVTVDAVDVKVAVADGVVTASFAMKLTNGAASTVSGLSVEFGDGSSVAVADLAPGKSRTTDLQQKVFTAPEGGSRNFPVAVTLKFVVDGVASETPGTLYLHVQ